MPRSCIALHEGQRCGARARPGQDFCFQHHPHPFVARQCEYFNRLGERCRCTVIRGQNHCFTHSPRNRHATRPAIPIVPRTRRQKAQARLFIFSNLARWKTIPPEIQQDQ